MRKTLLTLCLLLAGCASHAPSNRIRIATACSGLQTYCMPITLADTLGFFKEEGLDVTLDNLPTTIKSLQALVGGSADVAGTIYQHTLQMVAEGQPLRAFFIFNVRDSKVLMVAPAGKDRIRRLEDLKGALIGVSAPGTATHLWMSNYLSSRGIPPASYTLVSIGNNAQATAALQSGRVHAAAVSGGDHFRILHRNPGLPILADVSTPEGMREHYGDKGFAGGTLSARQDWLAANPDAARRLTRALLRTHQWIASHSAEEILDKLPPSLHSPDTAADLKILQWSRDAYAPDGALPKGVHQEMQKLIDATLPNVRASSVPQSSVWTSEYLPGTK